MSIFDAAMTFYSLQEDIKELEIFKSYLVIAVTPLFSFEND